MKPSKIHSCSWKSYLGQQKPLLWEGIGTLPLACHAMSCHVMPCHEQISTPLEMIFPCRYVLWICAERTIIVLIKDLEDRLDLVVLARDIGSPPPVREVMACHGSENWVPNFIEFHGV